MTIEHRAGGDRLWVATARGLTSLPTSSGAPAQSFGGSGVAPPSCVVHAVVPLSGGGVLVGTEKGAAVVKDGVVTIIDEKKGIPLRAVWAVAEGPDGVLLLGSSAGLSGRNGGSWLSASMAGGHLRDDWVTALTVRGASVFVGTYNGGVTRLEWSGAFALGERLGGGYVNTAGMLVSATTLYVATMDGLLARPLQKDAAWKLVANAARARRDGRARLARRILGSSRRGILHRSTL